MPKHHRSAEMAELVRIGVRVRSRVRVGAELVSIRVKVRVSIKSSECHFG